jgi:outer membrane protein assembly factor BamB
MKTKKLACQGCGADIDPIPGEKYIDCAYCGTTNVLVSDTVQIAPGSAPPQAPPGAAQIPQIQFQLPTGPSGAEVKKAGKVIGLVVLSVVIAFVGIGATVFIRVFRGVSDAKKQYRQAFQKSDDARQNALEKRDKAKRILAKRINRSKRRAGTIVAEVHKKKGGAFRIQSDRPLTADVNDDGIADLLVRGSGNLVAALDGTTTGVLWKKTLSDRSRKIFLVGKNLLVAHGDHLTALAVKNGQQRWTTKLPDRADQVELRKSGLAVETGDDERLTLDPDTGKRRGGKTTRFKLLSADDGRKYVSNLGRAFRLKGRRRRARLYYCRVGQILRGKTVTRRRGPFTTRTTTYGCRDKRALVWALDKRGRKGFIIGLKKGGRKIWEHPLPGPARRFGGMQPIVSMHGNKAAVAHGGGRKGMRKRASTPITVELLDLTTGKPQWKHSLTGSDTVRGVVLTAKRVFIRSGSWIQILNATTGTPPSTRATSGTDLPAP